MKLLVETSGLFQILHAEQNELIRHTGLTVVEKSQFVAEYVGMGQVIIKGQVNDEASDVEWLDTLTDSDGDEELALASFLDRYPVDAASARKAEPSPVIPSTTQTTHNRGRQAKAAT